MPKKSTTKTAAKTTKKKVVAKKPVAKKPAARKAVSKKPASQKTSAKKCACHSACSPAECFWVNNGPVVDSKKNLKKAIKEMSDDQYHYHTARDGNDFARWVRDCLKDKACAARLEKAKTRTSAARALTASCCK